MPDINDEMKAVADYAVKSARERFKQDLDFTEQSIVKLDSILEKIYWGFSGHTNDEGKSGLIFNTAVIWGSYLGEYMRQKWGGTWILKGSDRVLSINNLEFAPIERIYQKITSQPDHNVEDYLIETNRIIYSTEVQTQQAQQAQYLTKNIGQPKEEVQVLVKPIPAKPAKPAKPSIPAKKPVKIEKRYVYIFGGAGAVILVLTACIFGFVTMNSAGISAFGLFPSDNIQSTDTPTQIILATATASSTSTPNPTETPLPTYTPKPTNSPRPSFTPSATITETPTATPTETEPPPPTRTRTPRPSATEPPPPVNPTNTPVPPTNTQAPPTNTQPPPPVIVSCDVTPSQVPAGQNNTLTFSVKFSAPGNYNITVNNDDPNIPDQHGCSAPSGGSDSASCNGTSGWLGYPLPPITAIINTTIGNCTVSYSSLPPPQ